MSIWLTVYCRTSIAALTPEQLLDGIRGRDRAAPAGVDYRTLAEDYGVDDELVGEAVGGLAAGALAGGDDGYEVRYGGAGERPLAVRRWHRADRVAEEMREIAAPERHPKAALRRVRETREVVGIEMRPGHLGDMGVVIAYEVARYLAQRGDGVIHTDEDRWLAVEEGAFVPLE